MLLKQFINKGFLNTPLGYLIVVTLGIMAGLSHNALLITIGSTIAEIFIKIFKCVSLPIIALSLIVTIANCYSELNRRAIWKKALTYTFLTTFVAALISLCLYLLIRPVSVTVTTQFAHHQIANINYTQYLSEIIPTNVFAPFIDYQVMGVLLISILVGIAIRFIPDLHAQETLNSFFKGLHSLFMVVTQWIINIIPIGIFGFITSTVVQLSTGAATLHGLGEYLLIIVLANLIQGFGVLPLWLRIQGIAPFKAFKGMLPALSVAFFSKSSVGTLPITIDTAEKNLHIQPQVSRFVLPLCTSLNMNGCAAFIFTTVVYVLQNQGIHLTLPLLFLWTFIATVAAIGNAGIPMGCFFLSASLLSSMNIPINLLGIILPFYTLIDMLETSLNVWSDSCVAKVVNEQIKDTILPDLTFIKEKI